MGNRGTYYKNNAIYWEPRNVISLFVVQENFLFFENINFLNKNHGTYYNKIVEYTKCQLDYCWLEKFINIIKNLISKSLKNIHTFPNTKTSNNKKNIATLSQIIGTLQYFTFCLVFSLFIIFGVSIFPTIKLEGLPREILYTMFTCWVSRSV